jgi:hypothetical protein
MHSSRAGLFPDYGECKATLYSGLLEAPPDYVGLSAFARRGAFWS